MKAQVEWDGHNWVAVLPEGGTTFARRLEQLPDRIVEVVELMSKRVIDAGDVELVIEFPGAEEAAALRAERLEVDERERALTARTATVVRSLRDRGVSLRDIAVMTGISYQRAHQIVSG